MMKRPLVPSGVVCYARTTAFVVINLVDVVISTCHCRILFGHFTSMTSHAEIRAAYESWCDANPFLPVEQYPDLEQMIEAADSEPVDRVSQTMGVNIDH